MLRRRPASPEPSFLSLSIPLSAAPPGPHIEVMLQQTRGLGCRASLLFAAIAALYLALSPGLADARAGFGGSFGSRGGMTWSAPPSPSTAPLGAQPMQRSITPNAASPAYGAGSPARGYGARSGFTS